MEKIFLSLGYSRRSKREKNNFLSRLYLSTSLICAVLIFVGVYLASSLPKEAFIMAFDTKAQTKDSLSGSHIMPLPSDEMRAKADRLREIRYEDYLAHSYTPLTGEMDNVYIYDNKKVCYLTFDDGPSSITEKILSVLQKYKVKATFFVTGEKASANPKIIKAIANAGHSIGNHTDSHMYNTVYDSADSFRAEVAGCKNAIDEALGYEYDNLIFRFPGGYDSLTDEMNKKTYRDILCDMGYKYIDWSALTGDSNTTEPTEEYIMSTLDFSIGSSKTGDEVVLMHDSATKEITFETLPRVIEYLYDKGYKFEALTNK